MATASTPLQGPLWVCGPTGTGAANKKETKWSRVPLATLTPAGSSSSSRYPTLQWCDDKDDKGSNKGSSKNSTTAADLVLVKVHPIIHVAEKQKKGGWLPSFSFASSSASSLPQVHFAVDALEARVFEKAVQYGLTPAPPKTYLLGFSSLIDARAWQEAATATYATTAAAAAASKKEKGGTTSLDAKGVTLAGVGLQVGSLASSAGVQGKGRVAVDASGSGAPALPPSAAVAEAAALPTLPYIDFPCAPPSISASSTGTTSTAAPNSSSSSSSSSFTTSTTPTNKSLEERLHALHHADQVQRLAALRNLAGVPVDEATLRARHAALKGEGEEERGKVEGGREGRREGGGRGQGFMEAAVAGLSENEMVEELLAQVAEDARLEGREGGEEEEGEEEDEAVRYALAAVTKLGGEGGGCTDDIDNLAAPLSAAAAPSEAALRSLLQEAQALQAAAAAEEEASPSATTAGATSGGAAAAAAAAAVQIPPINGQKDKKEAEQDAKEEGEDDPVLARCAAVLRAVGEGMAAENELGREREQKGEEEGEGAFEDQCGEEEDRTQVAAVMELAHLWAKEGRTEGEGEKEKKEVK